jgi:23S rRNA (cytosine1962-C5)-methyltransferase
VSAPPHVHLGAMDLEIGSFEGWELIDSGGERKLERFGDRVLDRPCPQAIWPKRTPERWKEAVAEFQRGEGGQGEWTKAGRAPDAWPAAWGAVRFQVRLTGFGNVGVFPEHAAHWPWMQELLRGVPGARVLNLFAYTGGATLACAGAGADVTHVDSARSVNGWAADNASSSAPIPGSIRFVAEDAMKFAKREARRGRRYHGIIIDPPTFGRGAQGEVWKIERDLWPLVETCAQLLEDAPLFTVLTAHSPGITPRVLATALSALGKPRRMDSGEMLLVGGDQAVPAGAYARAVF